VLTERERITKKVKVRSHGKTRTRLREQTITRTIGSVSFSLAAGQTTTLKVPLNRSVRTQLTPPADGCRYGTVQRRIADRKSKDTDLVYYALRNG
jgi:hypothetical protein